MKKQVIAIGLDAFDPDLMEMWVAEGHLPNLQKLIHDGTYGRIRNTISHPEGPTPACSTERLWSMAWSGCSPYKTGMWDIQKFVPGDYSVCRDESVLGVDFAEEFPPFYAFLGERRVAAFDLPSSGLNERINGKQILGWGGHYPFTPSESIPSNLLPDVIDKYGKNEVLYNDHGFWGDAKYAHWLYDALLDSLKTRNTIYCDLLNEEDWDLFVVAYPEAHSAGHELLHLTLPDHPLYSAYKQRVAPDYSPVLDVYKEVDRGIGQMLEEAPENAHVVCFSVHGMGNNIVDLLSQVILPETLYRWNFPGKQALAPGVVGTEPGPELVNPIRNSWQGEVWTLNHEPNPLKRFIRNRLPRKLQKPVHNDLVAPWILRGEGIEQGWMPTMWYSRLWPQMKAFSLPSFADGDVRINLKGRERDGIVLPEEYDDVCDELTELLEGMVDARTGEPVVDRVVRTRKYPTQDNDYDRLPCSDLVVLWKQNYPTSVVDSHQVGRIGPVPYPRPGGHINDGFVIAKGSGIEPGSTTQPVEGVDVGPTVLALLGAPIPEHLDGKPISTIVSGIQEPAV